MRLAGSWPSLCSTSIAFMHEYAKSLARFALLGAMCLAPSNPARAQQAEALSSAQTAHRGAYVLLTAGMFVPPEGGPLGASATGEVGYQLALRHVALAAGGRLSGYFSDAEAVAAGMAAVRATLLRALASPFLFAAIGPGYRSTPSELEVCYQVGAGFMIGVTTHTSVGAEAAYVRLSGTDFDQLFLGAALRAKLD
jgi:hypothetical protein